MTHAHAIESDTKPGRRERNKRAKLEKIIQAASDLFREHGFEHTTGRQICERADIGTGTLFLYVKDKRELLSLIFQPLAKEAFARLDRKIDKIDKNEPLIDGLIRVFAELFHLYGQDTAMSRLFIQDLLFRDNDSTGLKLLHDELRERVTKLVSAAQRRKELRSDISAEQLGISFLAHYVLWLQMWLGSGGVSRSSATRGLRLALQLQIEGAGKERTDQ